MENILIFTIIVILSAIALTSITSSSEAFLGGRLSKIWILSAGTAHLTVTIGIIGIIYFIYAQQYNYAYALILTTLPIILILLNKPRSATKIAGEQTIQVTTINLLYNNKDKAEKIVKELTSIDSDIIFIQEYSDTLKTNISTLEKIYPYSHQVTKYADIPDLRILSKLPLYNLNTSYVEERPALLADIKFHNQYIKLVNIHTISPVTSYRTKIWLKELKHLTSLARSYSTPLIIAGDFNATVGHKPFRDLMRFSKLYDATSGFATWSNKTWLPAWMHLDHILISEHWIKHADTIIGKGYGSDHKPVTVSLYLKN